PHPHPGRTRVPHRILDLRGPHPRQPRQDVHPDGRPRKTRGIERFERGQKLVDADFPVVSLVEFRGRALESESELLKPSAAHEPRGLGVYRTDMNRVRSVEPHRKTGRRDPFEKRMKYPV